MRATTLRWCNRSGWAFLLLWLVGFVLCAHVVPPPSPNESAAQIAEFYRANTGGIGFGLMLTLFASPLYASWSAALAAQMKRVRAAYPVMADLQLLLGGLADRGVPNIADAPVFPRWVGYFNVWTAILFLPGPLCVFFRTGPLAWDGLFTWWIPFVLFAAWMVVMLVMIAQAIRTDDSRSAAEADLERRINAIVDARLNTPLGTA
jgi:hypothetical protein